MAKKVLTQIKLQAVGGQASPAPPVGPALGQHGVNIMEFVKAFNAQTQSDGGHRHPGRDHGLRGPLVHVRDQEPAGRGADQAGDVAGEGLGRAEPREGRARSPRTSCGRSPSSKMKDLNANDIDAAAKIIAGHRPLDGRGGRLVMAHHGKAYEDALKRLDREREYQPAEAVALVKELSPREVRRVGRAARPHGPERPSRRRAAAWHDRAPQRARQGRQDHRVRSGRQGPRGRGGGCRRGRRRGPRAADPGRIRRFRRGDRDP